jgi:hypothetical protein
MGAQITQSVYRLATRWMTEGSEFESRRGQEFSLHVVQTGSGVHPASHPMGTGGSFPGGKAAGSEADHSPPTSAEVRKIWIYTCTPLYTLALYQWSRERICVFLVLQTGVHIPIYLRGLCIAAWSLISRLRYSNFSSQTPVGGNGWSWCDLFRPTQAPLPFPPTLQHNLHRGQVPRSPCPSSGMVSSPLNHTSYYITTCFNIQTLFYLQCISRNKQRMFP